ncbi:hypothetical protein [Chryseobacterium sp. OSA05B]|uniref:hypothetical protein n=1 Tax=Chryseobacterium sp. OSA05B TaxID=2862650 RepID=UPI001CBC2FF9|nr:hypothetical protein [Chryseobacterium sp. OSA05B]
MKIKSLKPELRFNLIISSLIFSVLLGIGFLSYLEPTWGYFGLEKDEPTIKLWGFYILFAVLPSFFLPKEIVRPSMFGLWVLYILTYIPMITGAFFDKQILFDQKLIVCLSYCVGFMCLCIFYAVKLFRPKPFNIPHRLFWTLFYFVVFSMLIYIVFLYRNSLTFVNIFSSDEVYETRFAGQEIQEQSAFAGHIILWLSNAFFPFILSVGLIQNDKSKKIIGIGGLIILYMTMANKQYIFSIVLIYLIYKLFASQDKRKIFKFFKFLIIPTAVLLFFNEFVDVKIVNDIVFALSGIFLFRTLYTSTLMSVYYNVFFENHPHTYFSHVSIINKVVEYPYKEQLGIEVGTYFIDIDRFNANANFFITDGLSSVGYPGVIIMGIFGSFIFYLFDSFSTNSSKILGILLITVSCVALMNVSMFTTLISGGLLFFMFLLNNNNIIKK